jgi:hypothetical protein
VSLDAIPFHHSLRGGSYKLHYFKWTITEVGFSSLLHRFLFIIGCHNKELIYVKVTHETFQQGKNHNKIMKGPFYKNFIWTMSVLLKLNMELFHNLCIQCFSNFGI